MATAAIATIILTMDRSAQTLKTPITTGITWLTSLALHRRWRKLRLWRPSASTAVSLSTWAMALTAAAEHQVLSLAQSIPISTSPTPVSSIVVMTSRLRHGKAWCASSSIWDGQCIMAAAMTDAMLSSATATTIMICSILTSDGAAAPTDGISSTMHHTPIRQTRCLTSCHRLFTTPHRAHQQALR